MRKTGKLTLILLPFAFLSAGSAFGADGRLADVIYRGGGPPLAATAGDQGEATGAYGMNLGLGSDAGTSSEDRETESKKQDDGGKSTPITNIPRLTEPSFPLDLLQMPQREEPHLTPSGETGENLPRLSGPSRPFGLLQMPSEAESNFTVSGQERENFSRLAEPLPPFDSLPMPPRGEPIALPEGEGRKSALTLTEPPFQFSLLQTPLKVEPLEDQSGEEGETGDEGLDKNGLMESIAYENSRDNYQAALDLLDKGRAMIGDSSAYRREKARILALSGRSAAAIKLTDELMKNGDGDATVYYTRTIAFYSAHRSEEAMASLRKLQSINPAGEETEEARRLILAPLRPFIEGGVDYYHDSDSLGIIHQYLRGEYFKSPETRISARMDYRLLHVDREPSLETLTGGKNAWYSRFWVGGGHRFSPGVDVDLKLGESWAENQAGILSYFAALNYRANDELQLLLSRTYDYFLDSPRTVSLSVKRGANSVQAEWKPALDYEISGGLEYDTFSDGNRSWEAQTSVQKKFFVKSLDIQAGPAALWTGFSKQLDHGYYNPSLYQRYVLATSTDWSVTDDLDLNLALSLGANKDEEMTGFGLSYDATLEGDLALHRNWKLRLNAGILRDSGQTGSYSAFTLGAFLTKRF